MSSADKHAIILLDVAIVYDSAKGKIAVRAARHDLPVIVRTIPCARNRHRPGIVVVACAFREGQHVLNARYGSNDRPGGCVLNDFDELKKVILVALVVARTAVIFNTTESGCQGIGGGARRKGVGSVTKR